MRTTEALIKGLQWSACVMPSANNRNWAEKDVSSQLRLGFGQALGPSFWTGASFRTAETMGGFGGSCQYWKPHGSRDGLRWVNSGWNPYLVGVGEALFNKSRSCGQCLHLYNPDTQIGIVAVITDYCPKPCSRHQLDLHAAGSAFLASGRSQNAKPYKGGPENHHRLRATPVACDWHRQTIHYYFDRGSSRFQWYLIVYGHNVPIEEVVVIGAKNQRVRGKADHFGRFVFEWHGRARAGWYEIRLKSRRGDWIKDRIRWAANRVYHSHVGRAQFKNEKVRVYQGWP